MTIKIKPPKICWTIAERVNHFDYLRSKEIQCDEGADRSNPDSDFHIRAYDVLKLSPDSLPNCYLRLLLEWGWRVSKFGDKGVGSSHPDFGNR